VGLQRKLLPKRSGHKVKKKKSVVLLFMPPIFNCGSFFTVPFIQTIDGMDFKIGGKKEKKYSPVPEEQSLFI